MEYSDIQPLLNIYHRNLASTNLKFKRYLYKQINWDARLLGIKGARGVGKTTLLLQRIKENFTNIDDVFYVSLDNLWFQNHRAEDLVEFLYTHGVHYIFFDEVHKYPNWTLFIKNLYDSYPDLNIVYTGSAMLAIDNSKVDLSRRQSLYSLKGLSFREYLEYEGIATLHPLSLEELLKEHVRYAMNAISGIKVLKYFEKYLDAGYYPYYKTSGKDYPARIGEVTQLVIDSDIAAIEESITYATKQKIKKLLMVIAENIPLERTLVVVDDLSLPFGALRMKPSGSDGGHNGLKHIASVLGTQEYARLRFGIGNDFPRGGQINYVLGHFTDEDMKTMDERVALACEMIKSFCLCGIQITMNQYNKK